MSTKKELLNLCNTLGIIEPKLHAKKKEYIKQAIKNLHVSKGVKNITGTVVKEVKYIYHTADIHIRCLARHQEYKQVFENLYTTLTKMGSQHLNESVLVICGDIFHNRDRLVSETIILFNNFIDKLTSVIDVIVILGNHDTFTHTDRLDTITGIFNLKTTPNFYFFKESSVYRYFNILFYVSSLYDNKFIRCPKKDIDHTVKHIALYHGPVYGCKLDNGLPYFSKESIKLSDFKDFDYALLGDIHKRQHLSNTIAYPGSLIQQNHSEDSIRGILRWDLHAIQAHLYK